MVTSPVVKILAVPSVSDSFYAITGTKILLKPSESEEFVNCFSHPEGKKWSPVAALSGDEKVFAVCDCEKNLYLFEIGNDSSTFKLISVPMHLAKTATSLKFTDYPSKWTVLVADKFGDVLRFQLGEEFDRWAHESRKDSKSLSIHTKTQGKRTSTEAEGQEDSVGAEEEVQDEAQGESSSSSEAHHCTIIGHISMVTDLQILPIRDENIFSASGLIVTCDRDEKVRLTRADRPEIIHSFGLAHREFVGTLATCEATRSIYSAGGDKFIAEWVVEGEQCEKLTLKSKIELEVDGIVQEVKINAEGTELLVHVDKFGLLRFKCVDGSWKNVEKIEAADLTTFDFSSSSIFAARWSPGIGTTFLNSAAETGKIFDEVSVEEGVEIVDLLSKAKLKKDVERMDWKQKKHANQKPRN